MYYIHKKYFIYTDKPVCGIIGNAADLFPVIAYKGIESLAGKYFIIKKFI